MKKNMRIYLAVAVTFFAVLTVLAFAINKNEISSDYKKSEVNEALKASVSEKGVKDDCCAAGEGKAENKAALALAESNGKEDSCCPEEMGKSEYSDNSIYQLDQQWKDETGSSREISALKGQKVVLSMIFANCTYACPIIVNDMKKVEAALSSGERKDVRFVLVSIDPERDTPEALKKYAGQWNLDLKRWELLTGTKEDIRELAALFGFKYKKDEKGDYSHSNLINVLNREGEIAFQHEGLNKDVSDIVKQLKKLN